MSLPPGWQNHLLATHAATEEIIDRIKRIAVDGRSPANHRLTPISDDDWRGLQVGLDNIGEQFSGLLQSVANEQLQAAARTQPFTATRYHLSLALMSLEQEVLAGIDPDQVPRRGVLPPDDKEQIRSALKAMQDEISTLRLRVERLSEPTL